MTPDKYIIVAKCSNIEDVEIEIKISLIASDSFLWISKARGKEGETAIESLMDFIELHQFIYFSVLFIYIQW